MYIERQLEKKFIAINEEYACVLLTGPRQVGKSTMLRHLMEGTARAEVSLDDLEERRLAKTDPAMFLKLHPAPVLIDEVQYAPELFSYIKIAVDNGAAPGSYWLTGSQAYRLMELAQESLAGRTAILHMSALSQSELCGAMEVSPFSLELDELQKRKALLSPATPNEIYQRIWDGALPGHRSGKYKDRDVFYSSYIQTYIDRDVTTDIPGVDKVMFADFIRAAACRSGQMLNLHDIAGDVGVSDDTAKRWMKELEKSGIVFFLHPYSNNLLKRTIKTPKMYFFDTGLVSYLTRYSSPEILMNGAINGAILENYVVSEIIKTYSNSAKDCLLHYYRDKNSNEIDLIMESDGQLHPIEIKKKHQPAHTNYGRFQAARQGLRAERDRRDHLPSGDIKRNRQQHIYHPRVDDLISFQKIFYTQPLGFQEKSSGFFYRACYPKNINEGGSKMTNEELNTALYKKVFAEQEKYREWLLSQPPDEILNHCYEYTVREDIVLALEEYDLSDKQCKALLKSPSPLADVFKDFEKRETDHMDNIRDTIECRANAVIRTDFLRDRREAR